jgi:hypothetical protein
VQQAYRAAARCAEELCGCAWAARSLLRAVGAHGLILHPMHPAMLWLTPPLLPRDIGPWVCDLLPATGVVSRQGVVSSDSRGHVAARRLQLLQGRCQDRHPGRGCAARPGSTPCCAVASIAQRQLRLPGPLASQRGHGGLWHRLPLACALLSARALRVPCVLRGFGLRRRHATRRFAQRPASCGRLAWLACGQGAPCAKCCASLAAIAGGGGRWFGARRCTIEPASCGPHPPAQLWPPPTPHSRGPRLQSKHVITVPHRGGGRAPHYRGVVASRCRAPSISAASAATVRRRAPPAGPARSFPVPHSLYLKNIRCIARASHSSDHTFAGSHARSAPTRRPSVSLVEIVDQLTASWLQPHVHAGSRRCMPDAGQTPTTALAPVCAWRSLRGVRGAALLTARYRRCQVRTLRGGVGAHSAAQAARPSCLCCSPEPRYR